MSMGKLFTKKYFRKLFWRVLAVPRDSLMVARNNGYHRAMSCPTDNIPSATMDVRMSRLRRMFQMTQDQMTPP